MKHAYLVGLLEQLEQTLYDLNFWQDEKPSPEALASTQPFAIDTLAFEQWLQWLFIPKMYQLIQIDNLPPSCDITPYLDEWAKKCPQDVRALRECIVAIDNHLQQLP